MFLTVSIAIRFPYSNRDSKPQLSNFNCRSFRVINSFAYLQLAIGTTSLTYLHILSLGLKVLWLGGTDNRGNGSDSRQSVPVS